MLASKVSLYAVSIWLNTCCLMLIRRPDETRTRAGVYREFVIAWMISFGLTNLLWEWPWFLSSKFIFSFSEVFGGYSNMSGNLADTLLALVWTQYQYVFFPAVMFYFSLRLLLNDQVPDPKLERVYGS